jgi:transcription initiation factor TFIIIB Brf1 subunit/transcription initiation factor TFIIB
MRLRVWPARLNQPTVLQELSAIFRAMHLPSEHIENAVIQ